MSIEACRCGVLIDTDQDAEAYVIETNSGEDINLSYALCQNCRDNFQGLLELSKTVDQFTQDVFDWVGMVGDNEMLSHLYCFKRRIENLTDPENMKGKQL